MLIEVGMIIASGAGGMSGGNLRELSEVMKMCCFAWGLGHLVYPCYNSLDRTLTICAITLSHLYLN